jgi:hypothetical protein
LFQKAGKGGCGRREQPPIQRGARQIALANAKGFLNSSTHNDPVAKTAPAFVARRQTDMR